jgi:hypothetical protein
MRGSVKPATGHNLKYQKDMRRVRKCEKFTGNHARDTRRFYVRSGHRPTRDQADALEN